MHRIAFAIASILCIFMTLPALAQGEVVITQAKALAGNVTPGDAPGFPVHLTVSGAYVLQSNLVVPANLIGINVTANNVDIDLNGFTISGGGVATNGIKSNAGESRIHNGVINRFQGAGVYLRGNSWVIEDMQIVRNGGRGIDAVDIPLINVRNSLVNSNGADGIYAGDNATIRDSSIVNNGLVGIRCNLNCNISGNNVDNNAYHGIYINTGIMVENTISRSSLFGVADFSASGDVGLANNMFIDNYTNPSGTNQRSGGVDLFPNSCASRPC